MICSVPMWKECTHRLCVGTMMQSSGRHLSTTLYTYPGHYMRQARPYSQQWICMNRKCMTETCVSLHFLSQNVSHPNLSSLAHSTLSYFPSSGTFCPCALSYDDYRLLAVFDSCVDTVLLSRSRRSRGDRAWILWNVSGKQRSVKIVSRTPSKMT